MIDLLFGSSPRRIRMVLAVAVCAATMLVAPFMGCNSSREPYAVEEESYPRIKVGMSRSKLETLFGPATEMSWNESLELFGELEAERFEAFNEGDVDAPQGLKWENETFSLYVLLVDGKVVAKAQQGELESTGDGSPAGIRS